MKTQIITLFAALVLSAGIAGTAKAATVEKENVTILNNISNINKIEVRGNVELYLSDGNTDQVKVYNKYYSESALIQSDKGVLRISSYKAEKLVVWVTAKDLRAIAAYDNADVKSFGTLSKIEFTVDLHNDAKANLNLDAFSASVSSKDNATASISGSVNQYRINSDNEQSIDSRNLSVVSTVKTFNQVKQTKLNTDDLADL